VQDLKAFTKPHHGMLFLNFACLHPPLNTTVGSAGEEKYKACTWKMRYSQKYWSENTKKWNTL